MPSIEREDFGTTIAGQPVERYALTNRRGSRACFITRGATLTELWMPDRRGALGDVVLGCDSLEAYERTSPYLGCTIGRVANRIAGARFELDGRSYPLAANDGAHHLHGGTVGFDKVVWKAEAVPGEAGPAVRFTHTSPNGDEGYPGTLEVNVTFRLDHDDRLHITYRARTDALTPLNLTNHSYWNLAGGGDILDHVLRLDADRVTEVDDTLIPTGRLLPVAGTAFDFTRAKPIGRDITTLTGGYDHNFVLADARRTEPVPAGELYDPASGRAMAFATTEPGAQLYTSNFMDRLHGKRGATHGHHRAVCLEAQMFPDALHQPDFPSIVLRPGEVYRQDTVHAFSVR